MWLTKLDTGQLPTAFFEKNITRLTKFEWVMNGYFLLNICKVGISNFGNNLMHAWDVNLSSIFSNTQIYLNMHANVVSSTSGEVNLKLAILAFTSNHHRNC